MKAANEAGTPEARFSWTGRNWLTEAGKACTGPTDVRMLEARQ
jgi:hypothetical protein